MSADDPNVPVVFRSERWLSMVDSVPVYIAVVGDDLGTVRYEAELFDLQIDRRQGTTKTRELRHLPPGTRDEGLGGAGTVRTQSVREDALRSPPLQEDPQPFPSRAS
jgi:hypothetical protein